MYVFCVYFVDVWFWVVLIFWICGWCVYVWWVCVFMCVCVSLSLSLSTYQQFSLVAVCKKHFQGLLPRVVGSKKTTLQLLLLATTTPSAASIPLSYGLFCWFGFCFLAFCSFSPCLSPQSSPSPPYPLSSSQHTTNKQYFVPLSLTLSVSVVLAPPLPSPPIFSLLQEFLSLLMMMMING